MSSRVDYYFRQKVTEAELNLGFALLEQADRALASDIGVYGILYGAVPSSHAPIADLTIDLTAPACAYDRLGQRIFFGTAQRVDVSVDLTGVPTDVPSSAQERWVGVFLRFHRLLSDPRTDGNSQQVFFRQDESFELVVRQGPVGPVGVAPRVGLVDGEILVCDVRRRAGQSQVLAADIDLARRQSFVFAQSTAVAVTSGLWTAITKAARTAQNAFDSIDSLLSGHFGATGLRHRAKDVDYPPHGFVASNTVGAALDEIVDDLTSTGAGAAGAARVGSDAIVGAPKALVAGTVRSQLATLLGWLNDHVGAATGAHAASAIAATPFAFVASKSVQAQLQELVADLQSAATGQGAALVGSEALGGAPRAVTGTKLRDQLVGLLTQLNAHVGSGDHDARYLRLLFSGGDTIMPGATSTLGPTTEVPSTVTVACSLANNFGPTGPLHAAGPLVAALAVDVVKLSSGGANLVVTNNSSQQLFVMLNAFVIG